MQQGFTIIIHIYYKGSWAFIKSKLGTLLQNATEVIITGCYDEVLDEIDFEKSVLLKVPNVGKDIGGKLAAINYYLRFGVKTSCLLFLHDKISPQSINADYWLTELYSIMEQKNFKKIIETFENNKKVGLMGSRIFLKNEYLSASENFDTSNDQLLRQLIKKYELRCKKYDYIAGTMFIVRSSIFETFFSKHKPLDIRSQLEVGNVLDLKEGTVTHCWERLFCFIVEHYNYQVKGI